eukprot:s60_g53.t1
MASPRRGKAHREESDDHKRSTSNTKEPANQEDGKEETDGWLCAEMAKYLHTSNCSCVVLIYHRCDCLSMSFTLAPSSSLLCGSGSTPAPVFGVAG